MSPLLRYSLIAAELALLFRLLYRGSHTVLIFYLPVSIWAIATYDPYSGRNWWECRWLPITVVLLFLRILLAAEVCWKATRSSLTEKCPRWTILGSGAMMGCFIVTIFRIEWGAKLLQQFQVFRAYANLWLIVCLWVIGYCLWLEKKCARSPRSVWLVMASTMCFGIPAILQWVMRKGDDALWADISMWSTIALVLVYAAWVVWLPKEGAATDRSSV